MAHRDQSDGLAASQGEHRAVAGEPTPTSEGRRGGNVGEGGHVRGAGTGDSAAQRPRPDWGRWLILACGLIAFVVIFAAEAPSPAVDPSGRSFPLTREGKAALGLVVLAVIWWVTEVVPLGITSITIGVIQALLQIRPAKVAFGDFMDPAVWFIFASLTIGIAFTKTGITRRLAYRMLCAAGERTSRIYLGCFVLTALLSHVMAHTAAAATMFPVLLAIYSLYGETDRPTRFGKGLFIGMAFSAGAGSIVTLLGSARGVVAITFFRTIVERKIGFFDVPLYLAPVGWAMVFVIWRLMLLMFPPEKEFVPELPEAARRLHGRLGPLSRQEVVATGIVLATVLVLVAQAFVPALDPLSRPAILLVSTLLFFILGILTIDDLNEIPWNIILLFGGAMSMGFCLWETGAAEWLAVKWLGLFHSAHWLVFLVGLSLLVLFMTNVIMNVAAIVVSLPVAMVIAGYLGVAPDVTLYISLATAGMPFLFLVGAAPNAIAYRSEQFTAREFLKAGVPASLVLLVVVVMAILVVWPLLGMPVTQIR